MRRFRLFRLAGLFLLLTGVFVSCSKDDEKDPIEKKLDEVRSLTASFHNIDVAMAAGWAVDLSGCVQHPVEGGMGHISRLESECFLSVTVGLIPFSTLCNLQDNQHLSWRIRHRP